MNFKSIFITGAASGIGKAVAKRFAKRGWFVGLADVQKKPLNEVAEQLDSNTSCHCMDVTDPVAVETGFDEFASHTDQQLDVLFLSAGITRNGRFEDINPKTHREILNVNAGGVAVCSRIAFPLLKQTPGARLISMSSASATYGSPEMVSYSASKFAVRGFTEALSLEWEEYDIHVCDVMSPFVKTPMLRKAQSTHSMEMLGVHLTAKDVAEVVENAATSRRKKVHWPVGGSFRFLYRLFDLLPRELTRIIAKRIGGF
jgi:NAD(P)-dependent dehydrogenase (short-subunit alcohol dehydrogenase family)